MIIGDDQGYPYFGFMGADYVRTPNMDILASSGTLLTHGYVPDNHCRPSLQTLITGIEPVEYNLRVEHQIIEQTLSQEEAIDFRHHAMKSFLTLPKVLAGSGYVSFQGGKWWEYHFENGGFSHGMTTGWSAEERKESHWFKKFMGGSGLALARATMEPVYQFIEEQKENPFFIWFAPELPHYPFDAPEKYYSLYRDAEMTESAKRYYANCSWFDDGVGALIHFLKEKNEFDNTLFIYVNDNGWEQNPDQEFRHDSLRCHNGGDKGKLSMYDQSYRTPIILSWKDHIKPGARIDRLVHSSDIPATILDYVGITIPETFCGYSVKHLIENPENLHRSQIIGRSTKLRSEEDMMGKDIDGYWLRNDRWFFNWDATSNEVNLYDMKIDPNNDQDVSEQHAEVVLELKEMIEDWKQARMKSIQTTQ